MITERLLQMEALLNKATERLDTLEKMIEDYERFQSEIQKLEEYYTSQQRKAMFMPDICMKGLVLSSWEQ